MPAQGPSRFAQNPRMRAPGPQVLATSRRVQAEDDLLAFLLINTWALITGRTLRSDVPPAHLGEDELIEFWADEGIAPTDSPAPARFPLREGRG